MRSLFLGAIALFFAYVGIRIVMIKLRENERPPRRPAAPGGTGDSAGTFGTSDMSASDMSPAGFDSGSSDSGGGDGGGWND